MNVLSEQQAIEELTYKINLARELRQRATEERAKTDFTYFVTHVFAASFERFTAGSYIEGVCRFLDSSQRTARISARDHFKSTSLYARFMWHLFRCRDADFEAHYFSYQQDMAGYHIGKIKKMVAANPYYAGLTDLKANAETVAGWSWDGTHRVTLEPKSLLAFKRGIHPDWIAVDDPFQDPDNKLEPTIILKINDVFVSQILDMPKVGAELHVVGTPQTPQDFFFNTSIMQRFAVAIQPAIVSEAKREALWPEHMSFEELEARRAERGPKKFAQEYLCSPVYTEDAWLEEAEVQACIDPTLVNYNPLKLPEGVTFDGTITAGFDIGKKRHPSHLAVFETKDGRTRQLASVWMDHWDYANREGEYDPNNPTQFEYLLEACQAFGIDRLYYDATRGELDSLKDAGKIPAEWEGIIFVKKRMVSFATNLSDMVTQGKVRLLDDARQKNQMLAVNNNLQAVETPQGHGDSFWSVAMALPEEAEGPWVGVLVA